MLITVQLLLNMKPRTLSCPKIQTDRKHSTGPALAKLPMHRGSGPVNS